MKNKIALGEIKSKIMELSSSKKYFEYARISLLAKIFINEKITKKDELELIKIEKNLNKISNKINNGIKKLNKKYNEEYYGDNNERY